MVPAMNHIDCPSEVIIPLKDANPENGLSDPPSEERTPHNKDSDNNKRNVGRCGLKLNKKFTIIIVIATFIGLATFISLVILVRYHVFYKEKIKKLEMKLETMSTCNLSLTTTPKPPLTTSCPQGWILNADSCYFFSETEDTWNSSNNNCSSYGASLLTMNTPKERAFINEKKAPAEYWLSLQRKNIAEPWTLPDGADFNVWFEIKGEGLCATLNDGVVSSTDCDSHRRWICRKSLGAV